MGTIAITWTEGNTTGNGGTVSKTYTIADADMDKIVAAYQSGANVSVNGTASRNQVLLYWLSTTIIADTQRAVQSNLTTPPVIPSAITMS